MSSGFITETEIEDARKQRQEEWEKVRTADQPLERPEEPYDGRSLYERLKEQKTKKDMEYEEAHKLKNLIRGLDDDEVQFLELVDQKKISEERRQLKEEQQEMEEFRNRVATLQEETVDKIIHSEIKESKCLKLSSTTRPSQKSLLSVGIKRKSVEVNSNNDIKPAKVSTPDKETDDSKSQRTLEEISTTQFQRGALKCIGVLPGIGTYTESSDSELSTGSEEDPGYAERGCTKFDLVGRKQIKKKCQSD